MITYSKKAMTSYIQRLEKLQKELGNVPTNIVEYADLHWLICVAIEDLKKVVEKEHETR